MVITSILARYSGVRFPKPANPSPRRSVVRAPDTHPELGRPIMTTLGHVCATPTALTGSVQVDGGGRHYHYAVATDTRALRMGDRVTFTITRSGTMYCATSLVKVP